MTSPWNRTRPEQPRRTTTTTGLPGRRPLMPRTPTRPERERFVTELLNALPAPDEEPVSTAELGARFKLDGYLRSNLLWPSLDRLARQGHVERVVKEGARCRYWRRAPADENQTDDADPRP
jgi:hypothetical protein